MKLPVRKKFWLIMTESGAPRVNSRWLNTPLLKRGEVAVLVSVEVPRSYWHPHQPEIAVKLTEDMARSDVSVIVPRDTTVIAVRVSDHPETTVRVNDADAVTG